MFYNSIFAMFCPLWEGETELSGLRMVRTLARSVHHTQSLTRRLGRLGAGLLLDHAVIRIAGYAASVFFTQGA